MAALVRAEERAHTDTGEREHETEGEGELRAVEPTRGKVVLRDSQRLAAETKDETSNEAHVVLLHLDADGEHKLARQNEGAEQQSLIRSRGQ
jgi:hypothetical protein